MNQLQCGMLSATKLRRSPLYMHTDLLVSKNKYVRLDLYRYSQLNLGNITRNAVMLHHQIAQMCCMASKHKCCGLAIRAHQVAQAHQLEEGAEQAPPSAIITTRPSLQVSSQPTPLAALLLQQQWRLTTQHI
jgi:hypothetical protein